MFSDDDAEEGEEDDTRLSVAKYFQNQRYMLQLMLLLYLVGGAAVEIRVCKSSGCSYQRSGLDLVAEILPLISF